METPTRFLLENGQFNLTPGFGSFGEVNPFDVSFTTSEQASLKAEADNHWQKHDHRSLLTPSDDRDSLFRSALRSNAMQDSRPGSMAQLPDMSRPFDMSPNTITALTSAPFTSATMSTAPATSMYGDNIALFPSLEPASLSLKDSPASGSAPTSASKKRKNQPATNAFTKKRTKRTKVKSEISSLASPPESNNDEVPQDSPESQSWEATQQVTPPGDNSSEEPKPKSVQRAPSSSKRPSARKSNSRRSSTFSKASSVPIESDEEGLDDEEKRKRFLERNRVAASKCRQKKKAWVNHLESQSEEISIKNKNLSLLVSTLKEEVLMLKNQLLAHSSCDCKVVRDYLRNQSNQTAALMKSQQAQHQSQPLAQNLFA